MSRRLSVIPIVHTEADLGRLASRVRERLGAQAWRRRQSALRELWGRIASWCDALEPERDRVTLYQDGLPAAPEAEAIVRELAGRGSVNHRILSRLIDRGATLVGPESPPLLLREYELVSRSARPGGPLGATDPATVRELEALLEARDAFIAERIDETLEPGSHGLLFIGALHHVERRLPDSIQVDHPLGTPGRGASEDRAKETRHAS